MNKEVEYLKEHLYEIYKCKKSMKDLTYDMDIEHLLRTCKALDYSQKEIERLNNELELQNIEMGREIERLSKMLEDKFYKEYPFIVENGIICKKNKEIERLHSIIKEAREYIDNDVDVYYVLDTRLNKAFDKTKKVKKDLLQILDKVGETDVKD